MSSLSRPRALELTPQEEVAVIENIEIIRKSGFDFEVDDNAPASKKLKLTAQPFSKNTTFGLSDLEELIVLLQDRPGEMVRCSKVRSMFASRACRKSVMVGTALNTEQMKKIVRHMSEIEQPWVCVLPLDEALAVCYFPLLNVFYHFLLLLLLSRLYLSHRTAPMAAPQCGTS